MNRQNGRNFSFLRRNGHPRPFRACVMAVSRLQSGHFACDSSAIHRCHAYGIIQGRLLHAYATPMIFN